MKSLPIIGPSDWLVKDSFSKNPSESGLVAESAGLNLAYRCRQILAGLGNWQQWAFVGSLQLLGDLAGLGGHRLFRHWGLRASIGQVLADELISSVVTGNLRHQQPWQKNVGRDFFEGLLIRGAMILTSVGLRRFNWAWRLMAQAGVFSFASFGLGKFFDHYFNERTVESWGDHLTSSLVIFVQGQSLARARHWVSQQAIDPQHQQRLPYQEPSPTNLKEWSTQHPTLFKGLLATSMLGLGTYKATDSATTLLESASLLAMMSTLATSPSKAEPVETLLERATQHQQKIHRQRSVTRQRAHPIDYRHHLQVLATLKSKLDYWRQAIKGYQKLHGSERQYYEQDIRRGLQILLDQVSTMDTPSLLKTDSSSTDWERKVPPALRAKALQNLARYKIGYGTELKLHPYQVMALNNLQEVFASRQDRFIAKKNLPRPLLEGVIVMPAAAAKAETLTASIALSLEQGVFRPERSDKIVIVSDSDPSHTDNLAELQRLRPYFSQKTGRDLDVVEYHTKTKKIAGPIVVVEAKILDQNKRREAFENKLKTSLGKRGRVAMVIADRSPNPNKAYQQDTENHKKLMHSCRSLSPHLFCLNFVTTPSWSVGPPIAQIKTIDFMRDGMAPRSYLVAVRGANLNSLSMKDHHDDFKASELTEILLGQTQVRYRLFASLEKHGLQRTEPSPSRRPQLEASLGFAANLAHARQMAKDYCAYFAKPGRVLKGRRLRMLGQATSKLTLAEIDQALANYNKGDIDGLVAVVSKRTSANVHQKLFKAVAEGKIEAVFNVDLEIPQSERYPFTHLLGTCPTFRKTKKAYQRDHVAKRNPDEMTDEGLLTSDTPKIIFDVVHQFDNAHSYLYRPLVRYGDIIGAQGYHLAPPGALFDVLSGKVVERVDRRGRSISDNEVNHLKQAKPVVQKSQTARQDLDAKAIELNAVLERQYGGNIKNIAQDLGMEVARVTELLQGQQWSDDKKRLRELATLLYLDRETFVQINQHEVNRRERTVTNADMALLKGALSVYEQREGKISTTVNITTNAGWGAETVKISMDALRALKRDATQDRQWRGLWLGLTHYFLNQSRGQNEPEQAREQLNALFDGLFEKKGWKNGFDNASEKLRWELRKRLALKFGGTFKKGNLGMAGVNIQNEDATLWRFAAGDDLTISRTRSSHSPYPQIAAFLTACGIPLTEASQLTREAFFEQMDWLTSATNPGDKLLLVARQLIFKKWQRLLPWDTGIDGIGLQGPEAALYSWLMQQPHVISGKDRLFTTHLSEQIEILLTSLGADRQKVTEQIDRAIFAEHGWPLYALGAMERLRLLARQKVVQKWRQGEIPPSKLETKAYLYDNNLFKRWLAGEDIAYTAHQPPKDFYDLLYSTLVDLGEPSQKVERMIHAAIFEERGWPMEASNSWEQLRLLARWVVVKDHYGKTYWKESDRLNAWINGQPKPEYSTNFNPENFYTLIEDFLCRHGHTKKDIHPLLDDAVFDERQWPRQAKNAVDKLRLMAQWGVAKKWRGRVPAETNIPGIPRQNGADLLNAWLNRQLSQPTSTEKTARVYGMVDKLLVALGKEQKEVDDKILKAVFEQNKWSPRARGPIGKIRFKARQKIARKWHGHLPNRIPGLPQQGPRALLRRWIDGEQIKITDRLRAQVTTLLELPA